MLKKDYEYELGVSYARENQTIVDVFSAEFKKIFKDSFFQDVLEVGAFLGNHNFEKRLKEIFNKQARVVVIFYSKDYLSEMKRFTKIEFKSVLERLEEEKEDFLFFIINLDKTKIDEKVNKKFYLEYDNNCSKLVNSIKKTMMEHNMESRFLDTEESIDLKIQTRSNRQNPLGWEKNFNWCFLENHSNMENEEEMKLWKSKITKEFYEDFNTLRNLASVQEKHLNLVLNCHLSLAYIVGHWYGDVFRDDLRREKKSNISLSGRVEDVNPFDLSNVCFKETKEENNDLEISPIEKGQDCSKNIILIINISHPEREIRNSIKKQLNDDFNINYEKIIEFKSFNKIMDSQKLIDYVKIITKKTKEAVADRTDIKLHIFAKTLTPLMFLLGGAFNGIGNVQLYEFDFDRGIKGYSQSFEKKEFC